MADYLVQEVDSVSRFTLENATGFILLEAAGPPPAPTIPQGGVISVRRRLLGRKRRLTQLDDEAIAVTLTLRTVRRRTVRHDTQ